MSSDVADQFGQRPRLGLYFWFLLKKYLNEAGWTFDFMHRHSIHSNGMHASDSGDDQHAVHESYRPRGIPHLDGPQSIQSIHAPLEGSLSPPLSSPNTSPNSTPILKRFTTPVKGSSQQQNGGKGSVPRQSMREVRSRASTVSTEAKMAVNSAKARDVKGPSVSDKPDKALAPKNKNQDGLNGRPALRNISVPSPPPSSSSSPSPSPGAPPSRSKNSSSTSPTPNSRISPHLDRK